MAYHKTMPLDHCFEQQPLNRRDGAGDAPTERRVRERRREPRVLAVVVVMCLLLTLAGAAVYVYRAPRPVPVGPYWVIGPGCSPRSFVSAGADPVTLIAPPGWTGVFVFALSGSKVILYRHGCFGGGGANSWAVGGMRKWQFAGLTVLGP